MESVGVFQHVNYTFSTGLIVSLNHNKPVKSIFLYPTVFLERNSPLTVWDDESNVVRGAALFSLLWRVVQCGVCTCGRWIMSSWLTGTEQTLRLNLLTFLYSCCPLLIGLRWYHFACFACMTASDLLLHPHVVSTSLASTQIFFSLPLSSFPTLSAVHTQLWSWLQAPCGLVQERGEWGHAARI